MIRFVAYAALFMAAIVGAGWVYEAHHIVPVNVDDWPMLKAVRDLALTGVALLWLFRPSRVIIGLAMLATLVIPFFIGQRPPDPVYLGAAAACVGLAVIATHLRRHVPSPFAADPAPTAE